MASSAVTPTSWVLDWKFAESLFLRLEMPWSWGGPSWSSSVTWSHCLKIGWRWSNKNPNLTVLQKTSFCPLEESLAVSSLFWRGMPDQRTSAYPSLRAPGWDVLVIASIRIKVDKVGSQTYLSTSCINSLVTMSCGKNCSIWAFVNRWRTISPMSVLNLE